MEIRLLGSSWVNTPDQFSGLILIYAIVPILCLGLGNIFFRLRTDDKYDEEKLSQSRQNETITAD